MLHDRSDGRGIRDLGTLGDEQSRAFGTTILGRWWDRFERPEASSTPFITGPDGDGMTGSIHWLICPRVRKLSAENKKPRISRIEAGFYGLP